ncbi:MAG: hypothetical protein AB1611_05740 [bacterium]
MNRLANQSFRSVFLSALIGILLLMSVGCSNHGTAVFSKPTIKSRNILYSPWEPTRKVCVLPFDNVSKEQDVNLKVMEVFLTELFAADIFEDIVDPIQANAALGGMRIRKPDSLDKETIKALGDRLGVKYLILGTVTDFEYAKSKDSAALVGLSVRMIDVDNGNILWTGNCYKSGDMSAGRIFGFTNGPSSSKLSKEVCQQIVSSLKYQIRANSRTVSNFKAQAPSPEKTRDKVVTVDDPVEKRR